jgi:alpha-glucosidase
MNRIFLLFLSLILFTEISQAAAGKPRSIEILSPDQTLKATIRVDSTIRYDLYLNGRQILAGAPIGFKLSDGTLIGRDPVVRKIVKIQADDTIIPEIPEKSSKIRNRYNGTDIWFSGGFRVEFRLYDEGLAYRMITDLPGTIQIEDEPGGCAFAPSDTVTVAFEKNFYSSYETPYEVRSMEGISSGSRCYLPVLVHKPDGTGIWLGESNVRDFPGLWMEKSGREGFRWTHPGYPLKIKGEGSPYGQTEVLEYAPYVARTSGARTFPWRIAGVSRKDADLITNQLVYLLADPCEIADPSWIRPGWVILDWWARRNMFGVDFKSGINNETAFHFIDFCARYGIAYFLFDDGWSDLGDILKVRPGLDMARILDYAREKGVGILLWVPAATLDRQMTEALDLYQKWGVAGIKVDFMNRDDQQMMNYYEEVLKETARRQMVVNFHGTCKPTGIRRAYPNLLTQEGLIEFEYSGCSDWDTPDHHNTLPFVRNVAGPMDYIPGTFNNVVRKDFRIVGDFPAGMGTRAHFVAMAITTTSPMQMIPDAPSDYDREQDCARFLLNIPVVWDETRVLEARSGDYLMLARRHGRDWFVGATTDWTPREFVVDFSFLPEGNFKVEIVRDGPNSDIRAIDHVMENIQVNRDTKLKISLAPGGGWAARIRQ